MIKVMLTMTVIIDHLLTHLFSFKYSSDELLINLAVYLFLLISCSSYENALHVVLVLVKDPQINFDCNDLATELLK